MASTDRNMRDPAKRSAGLSNHDKLNALQKMFPIKRGLRLRAKGEKVNRKARGATLWLYIKGDQGYELHETVFAKREAQSVSWWSKYFASKVFTGSGSNSDAPPARMGVMDGAIIPGIRRRTRQHWTVRAVIGYNLHDSLIALYPQVHKRRHKAKP